MATKKQRKHAGEPAPHRRSKKSKRPTDTPSPRQKRLPTMEDSAIKDLEDAGIEYSEIRSEIVASRARLRESETRIATLMRSNGKKTYNHNGIRLKLREGHDSVSMQVKRHDRGNDEANWEVVQPAEGEAQS